MDKNINNVVKVFLANEDRQKASEYYWEQVIVRNRMKDFHMAMIKYCNIKDKNDKRYFYLITFTLNDENKDVDPKVVYKYIKNRLLRPALQAEKIHLVQELTQEGRPHFHASIKSKKFISKDRFKYYVKKYGFVDISKNHSQNYKTMLKYISKSNIPEELLGGLL